MSDMHALTATSGPKTRKAPTQLWLYYKQEFVLWTENNVGAKLRAANSVGPAPACAALPSPRARKSPPESLRGSQLPLRGKILDLFELEDRWLAFSHDGRPLTFFRQQGHRPGYRGVQFHRAVIGQRNEFFRV